MKEGIIILFWKDDQPYIDLPFQKTVACCSVHEQNWNDTCRIAWTLAFPEDINAPCMTFGIMKNHSCVKDVVIFQDLERFEDIERVRILEVDRFGRLKKPEQYYCHWLQEMMLLNIVSD